MRLVGCGLWAVGCRGKAHKAAKRSTLNAQRSKQRGAIMVLTLAVLAGLVAILALAASTQRVAFKAELNRMQQRRTEIAADAAAQYVMANLVEQSKTATNLQDDWATLGQTGAERFTLPDASFRIEVVDAASRINLNTVPQAQLQKLNFTTEQIDSLLDWREAGQTPRTEGAKDEYYNGLPEPYNAKLRRLDTIDELLLIKGFTAADLMKPVSEQGGGDANTSPTATGGRVEDAPILYDLINVDSVSQNVGPNGQAKLNVNSQQANVQQLIQRGLPPNLAAAIVQRRITSPFTSIGQVLALPGVNTQTAAAILDNLSIGGTAAVQGRINLNTVTEDVLNTVPDLTSDAIQAIIQQQSSGFTSLGQLASVSGMTTEVLRTTADLFSVNSQTFLVRILAEADGTTKAYEATISIEGDAPRLVRMTEAPTGALARWGWAEDSTTDTPIVEASSR